MKGVKSHLKEIILAISFIALGCMVRPYTVFAYEDIAVVIDPGHGGIVTADNNNGGAIYNGVQEKDINLITAQALYDELSQYKNVTPYLTRSDDSELSLDARIDFAKSVSAAVVVSIHYNASENHNFYGSEIFTSMYGAPRATGYGLGQCVMRQWGDFGSPSKGIKTRQGNNGDYYGLIRKGCEAGMPVVILEHGYIDNDKDFSRMNSIDKWQKLGILDATAIAEYYGFKKDIVQEHITPTVRIGSLTNPVLPDTTPPTSVNLVVDSYDSETGELKYSLSAAEPDDTLMYYGFMTGAVSEDTIFTDLELWDNTTGIQKGAFMVPKNYDGTITARVYNTYELFADSTAVPVSGDAAEESPKDENADGSNKDTEDGKTSESDDASDDSADSLGDVSDMVKKEILLNGDAGAADKIEITSKMVDDAANKTSQSSKSLLGLIVVGVVVGFVILIGVALLVVKAFDKVDRRRRGYRNGDLSGRKRKNDWDDEKDENGYYY